MLDCSNLPNPFTVTVEVDGSLIEKVSNYGNWQSSAFAAALRDDSVCLRPAPSIPYAKQEPQETSSPVSSPNVNVTAADMDPMPESSPSSKPNVDAADELTNTNKSTDEDVPTDSPGNLVKAGFTTFIGAAVFIGFTLP